MTAPALAIGRAELSTLRTGEMAATTHSQGLAKSSRGLARPLTALLAMGLDFAPVQDQRSTDDMAHSTAGRICCRRGCNQPVNKPTAKYCSVNCCSLDPERRERMRKSVQRASRRVIPMQRQLTIGFGGAWPNPEAEIARFCEGREDVPRGMSHLAG